MRPFLLLCLLPAMVMVSGCLGAFASNQARRQAARSADYYVRTYADPEISQEARNEIADTIVRSGNDRYENRVGVDDRGWLTNER